MNNFEIIKNTEWKEVEINGEIKEIPLDWEAISIGKCIEMEKNTKNSQILNSTILNFGIIPVVGQEVKFISGYINNIKPLIATKEKPTIIFGDHSCTLKLITFNYSLGGDGTKVFKGNNKIQTNCLFYSIKNLQFSTNGYKRHFSILKEKLINVPALVQQSAIATILSKQEQIIADIENLIVKHESRFQYLSDELLAGKLRVKEENGELVLYKNEEWKEVEVNGEIKEIPTDWVVDTFIPYINFKNGSAFKPSEWKNNGIPIIRIQNLTNPNAAINYYQGEKKGLVYINNGDYLFSWSGTIAIFQYAGVKALLNQHIFKISPRENDDIKYLVLCLEKQILNMNTNGLTMSHITLGEINRFTFALTIDKKEQKLISLIMNNQKVLINQKKELLLKEKQKFEWLLDNLLSGKYLIKEK